MMRSYRKPLIIATPKIGLKHSAYICKTDELSIYHKFSPILVDYYGNSEADFSKLKGVLFCSGQIFLEINKNAEAYEKETSKVCKFITIRIEELAPFPENYILEKLSKLSGNKECKFYWIRKKL